LSLSICAALCWAGKRRLKLVTSYYMYIIGTFNDQVTAGHWFIAVWVGSPGQRRCLGRGSGVSRLHCGWSIGRRWRWCRSVVRLVSCRYARLRRQCGVEAANWQRTFSYRLANVLPGVLEELTHPDGDNHTSLADCSVFKKGLD